MKKYFYVTVTSIITALFAVSCAEDMPSFTPGRIYNDSFQNEQRNEIADNENVMENEDENEFFLTTEDFYIFNMNQVYGSVVPVTVMSRDGNYEGDLIVLYDGSEELPKNAGTYEIKIKLQNNKTLGIGQLFIDKKQLSWKKGEVYDKVYDGNNSAVIKIYPELEGVIEGDHIYYPISGKYESAYFIDNNAGDDKDILTYHFYINVFQGDVTENYFVPSNTTAFEKANIFRKELTWNQGEAIDKLYDGTKTAEIKTKPALQGFVNGEKINIIEGYILFDSENTGDNKITAYEYNIDNENYYLRNDQPLFKNANIKKIKYIIVGQNGIIGKSNDGINWIESTLEDISWYGITYGNGTWLLSGYNNFAYSHDGINWEIVECEGSWNDVCYTEKGWAAAGSGGKIAYSADAVNWTVTHTNGNVTWKKIDYGQGIWITIGVYGPYSGYLGYSSDGVNWTVKDFNANVNSIKYGNNLWIAVFEDGKIRYSYSGSGSWYETFTGSGYWDDVSYGNGRWVAVSGGGRAAYSSNGTSWTEIKYSDYRWTDIIYGDNKFVAIGYRYYFGYSSGGSGWNTYYYQGNWFDIGYCND